MAGKFTRIAAILLAIALALFVIGFLLDALRWLLIVAAVVLLVAAAVGWRGRGDGGSGDDTSVTRT